MPNWRRFNGREAGRPGRSGKRLHDLGELRIKEMDEAGIDIQVLSHGAPSTQKLSAGRRRRALTRRVNDRLARRRAATSRRASAAFAALPTCDPESRGRRTGALRQELGFKGAMLHGLANGVFLDDKRFWPIFERAEELDVPIYLHPGFADRT